MSHVMKELWFPGGVAVSCECGAHLGLLSDKDASDPCGGALADLIFLHRQHAKTENLLLREDLEVLVQDLAAVHSSPGLLPKLR